MLQFAFHWCKKGWWWIGLWCPMCVLGQSGAFGILSGSTMQIQVATNVNRFNCTSKPVYARLLYKAQVAPEDKAQLVFRETSIPLRIRSLNCGTEMFNRILYASLNETRYPQIQIGILRIKSVAGMPNATETAVKILARIEINGRAREYWVDAQARGKKDQTFVVKGSHPLLMSSFGVTPPRAPGGLIAARDEIRIMLDLQVKVIE